MSKTTSNEGGIRSPLPLLNHSYALLLKKVALLLRRRVLSQEQLHSILSFEINNFLIFPIFLLKCFYHMFRTSDLSCMRHNDIYLVKYER